MVDNQLGARAHVFIIQLQEQYTHSSASLKGERETGPREMGQKLKLIRAFFGRGTVSW